MFTVAPRPGESKQQQRESDRLTQLVRALRELGIGSILAYSPQAKGRIERSFRTAQDRLVKHLRLAKISTMEAANQYLEKEYWPEWNERFASPVADFANHHRPLTPQLNLEAILSHVEERVIGNDTFSFAGRRYRIERADVQAGMRRAAFTRGTAAGWGVEGVASGPLSGDRRVRRALGSESAEGPPERSQGPQRGRPQSLDGRLLQPSQPAAVETACRLRKTIWIAG